MEQDSLSPKKYVPELELKSEIVYESLCDNYGKNLIDDVLKILGMESTDLFDDEINNRVLDILNGKV